MDENGLINSQEYNCLIFSTHTQASESTPRKVFNLSHGTGFFVAVGALGSGRVSIKRY